MFRKTGDGKVEVLFDNGNGILEALLYNFDFDDFEGRIARPLKAEHARFLDERIVPLLDNDRGAIWLQGRASKIGPNAWNMTTSMNRAANIQAHLYNRGIKSDQVQPDAVGEELAANHVMDDEHDRAVMMWVFPKFKFDPPPQRRVPQRPRNLSRKFRIAMLTGLSGSLAAKVKNFMKGRLSRGIGLDAIFFMVWDTTNNLSCIYVYIGISLGIGVAIAPPVSATTHGPWNDFTTDAPMGVWQFGRWSRFTSAGAGGYSVNWITIETPPGVENVYERIDTGTTYGGGATTSVGDFIRIDGPSKFFGP